MITRRQINHTTGLVPAYGLETRDVQRLFDASDATNQVALEIPNSQGTIEIQGPWQSIELNLARGEGQITINGMDACRDKLFAQVEVFCCLTDEAAQGLTGNVLVGEISSNEAARELAAQAGVALEWDNRLDYTLVDALEPVWHFAGTLLDGLKRIISPFNQGGEELAAVIPLADRVVVTAILETGPVAVDLASGFPVTNFTIRREKRPRPLARVILNKDLPQECLHTTESGEHVYTDLTGRQEYRVVYNREKIGPIVLSETTTKYVWWPGGGIVPGRWVLVKKEEITNTYDPTPTVNNACWRGDFKLVARSQIITHYRNDGNPGWGETTEVTYTYDDEGYITQEIQNQVRTDYYGPDTGKQKGEEVIQEYTKLTDELYVIARQTRSYTQWVSGDNETVWEENITYDTQLGTGERPKVATISPAKDPSRIDHQEDTLELGGVGEVVELRYFHHDDYWAWFKDRVQKGRYSVSFQAPAFYDLLPGTWIDLTTSADTVINIIQGSSTIQVAVKDILDALPLLFVRSVTVERRGSEQITTVEAVGWK